MRLELLTDRKAVIALQRTEAELSVKEQARIHRGTLAALMLCAPLGALFKMSRNTAYADQPRHGKLCPQFRSHTCFSAGVMWLKLWTRLHRVTPLGAMQSAPRCFQPEGHAAVWSRSHLAAEAEHGHLAPQRRAKLFLSSLDMADVSAL